MEQNQMIILGVVVVVVIIAAVLMMGGGGPAPVTPPVDDTTPPADDVTPPADDVTPPADDTTPPGDDIFAGIDFTQPLECTITTVSGGISTVSEMKMEIPKMRVDSTSQAGDSTFLTSDGQTFYLYVSTMGKWMIIESTEAPIDTSDFETEYTAPPPGTTYDCKNVADIPDGVFDLPAGAEVFDPLEGLEGLEDFDPSAFQ